MKIKYFSLPLIIFGCLTSCSSKNMKVISNEEAITKATEIAKRQKDSSLFQIPNSFEITISTNTSENSKTASGSVNSSTESFKNDSFNFDNLIHRSYNYTKTPSSYSENETIEFYDKEKGIRYVATNNNGYKTRRETSQSYDDAKNYFKYMLNNYFDFLTNNNYFSNISTYVESYKTEHDKYQYETDQHFNYSFGSNGGKTFQEIQDSKIKYVDTNATKYTTYSTNVSYENDVIVSSTGTRKEEITYKEAGFYSNIDRSNNTSVRYGNISIAVPDISQYLKIN